MPGRSERLAAAALFGAVAGVFTPIVAYTTPWGFNIDFIAIPWIVCYIIYDFNTALFAMGVSWPIISILDMDGGYVIGATTKLVASIWLILVPELLFRFFNFKREKYTHLVVGGVVGILVRAVVMVLFNLYIAVPLFYRIPIDVAAAFVVGVSEPFLGNISNAIGVFWAFVIIIMFWNIVQGALDLGIGIPIGKRFVRTPLENK
ncbi:MAG: ECF transporter S component [Candidatus Korarchaeota archaeon]